MALFVADLLEVLTAIDPNIILAMGFGVILSSAILVWKRVRKG